MGELLDRLEAKRKREEIAEQNRRAKRWVIGLALLVLALIIATLVAGCCGRWVVMTMTADAASQPPLSAFPAIPGGA